MQNPQKGFGVFLVCSREAPVVDSRSSFLGSSKYPALLSESLEGQETASPLSNLLGSPNWKMCLDVMCQHF